MARVSVLMPVYNGQDELVETIDSILQQTLSDWECVAVDDGSTDGTGKMLDDYAARDRRFAVVHTENQGITKALNAGISRLSGEYVARLDCGDLCSPQRFERQAEFLEARPDVVAVGCHAARISQQGWPIDVYHPPLTHEEIDTRHIEGGAGGIMHPAAMIRTAALRRIQGYCEDFRYAQDTDLWLRLAEIGRLSNLPEILLSYRLTPTGISSAKRQEQLALSHEAVRRARARRDLPPLPETPPQWAPRNTCELMEQWARNALTAGNPGTAARYALRVLIRRPTSSSLRVLIRAVLNLVIKR